MQFQIDGQITLRDLLVIQSTLSRVLNGTREYPNIYPNKVTIVLNKIEDKQVEAVHKKLSKILEDSPVNLFG